VPGTNTPPTISNITDQTTAQNGATAPIAFTVGDLETPIENLAVSSASSNSGLIPVSNIVFGGSGANRTVVITPALNQSGSATITVTVNDGSVSLSDSFVVTVTPAPPFTPVFLPFEAESGTLASPMAIASDQNASGGQFITTSTFDSGSATYAVDIPSAGNYVIWCRVLSPDGGSDSFYVSVDGGAEAIYATAQNRWTNAWQWTAVNDIIVTGTAARTFQLGAGRHNLVFRGREEGTALDQILVTNDPNYVPDVIFTITTPNANISSITLTPPGSATLTWPAVAGKTYRVVYKASLSDPVWTALVPDVISTGTTASKSDYVVGNRFYGVIQLP